MLLNAPIRLPGGLPSKDYKSMADIYVDICSKFPDTVFAHSLEKEDGGESITWGQLLIDASRVAFDLATNLDHNGPQTPVVSLLANSGYTYFTYILAAWLNNYAVQPLSTRNSFDGLVHLLGEVEPAIIVADEQHWPVAEKLANQFTSLVALHMRNPDQLGEPANDVRTANDKEAVDYLDSPAIIMHTSGSEGHPKPIMHTHRHCVIDSRLAVASKYAGSVLYSPGPLFHGMSMCAFTRWSTGSAVIPVFTSNARPLTGEDVLKHLDMFAGSITFITPMLLEEMLRMGEPALAILRGCQRVFFGGAPMKPEVAVSLVSRGVPLVAVFGSTETSVLNELDFPSEDMLNDWPYFHIMQDWSFRPVFRPSTEPDLYELVVGAGPEIAPSVINVNDTIRGYKSGDLWEKHPTKANLWKFAGRRGDVTVLSNGEKTDNIQMRTLLLKDPRIEEVLVFGTGKNVNGVVLSLRADLRADNGPSVAVQDFQSTVDDVNAVIPKHSRLIPGMVLLASPVKPFPLSDKRTLQVRRALALYEEEINEAFRRLDVESVRPDVSDVGELQSIADIKSAVRRLVSRVASRTLEDEEDFFYSGGLDSLDAIEIRRGVLPLMPSSTGTTRVSMNIAYKHSCISRLSEFVYASRSGTAVDESEDQHKSLIDSVVQKFSEKWLMTDTRSRSDSQEASPHLTIVMTGASGHLGCYVLATMLAREDVQRIFCLGRGSSQQAKIKQAKLFEERKLSEILTSYGNKVEHVAVDLASPSLGIETGLFKRISDKATHILHLAWELNFNWTLEHFVPVHISGTRNLINLALSSTRSALPHFILMSSIGAVLDYPPSSYPVPATSFSDPSVAGERGYGQSKYVAERLVDSVASRTNLPCTVIRAGQLSACTKNGIWSENDFYPILLKSSVDLGAIPSDLAMARWLPLDIAADCVCALALKDSSPSNPAYYNLESSDASPWVDLASTYQRLLRIPKMVPLKQWTDLIRSRFNDATGHEVQATRLIDFFSAMGAGDDIYLDVTATMDLCPFAGFFHIDEAYVGKHIAARKDW